MSHTKQTLGGMGMLMSVLAAHADTNSPQAFTDMAQNLPGGPNILYAMLGQVLNNPSSLLVIAFLCILAWLADDVHWYPSRYVPHLCVVVGASIYWLFTSEATVPTSFPHPQAVFIVNGTVCGFVAFIFHRQAVARLIRFFNGISAENNTETKKT